MAKLINVLDIEFNKGFKYIFKFVRVSASATASTREKSVNFCRYSRISDDIIT